MISETTRMKTCRILLAHYAVLLGSVIMDIIPIAPALFMIGTSGVIFIVQFVIGPADRTSL